MTIEYALMNTPSALILVLGGSSILSLIINKLNNQ